MKSDLQFKQDEKIINEYLRDIKRNLPFCGKEEKEFLEILSSAMYDFAETSSDEAITMTELVERFGTAADCVDSYTQTYVDHLSDNDMSQVLSGKKYLRFAVAGLAVISAISICSAALSHKKLRESKLSDIRSETIVIKEYEPYNIDDDSSNNATKVWAAELTLDSEEMGD